MAHTGSNGRGLRAATSLLVLVLPAVAACSSGGGDGESGGASSGLAVNADLEAESLTATATGVEAGESLEVGLRVRNLGPDPIPAFRMAVSLSVDDQPDAADLVLGTWSSAGLAAGGAFETTGSIQVPVAAAPGVYRLLLVADDDQRFAETDETNNLFATGAIQVSPPAHPDLVAEAVSFGPSAAAAGSTIDVSHQISNQGLEASGSFRLGIYLSSSPVLTTGGILIGQRAIPALDVGEIDAASGTLTIPSFVPPGTYFVGVLCDDQQQIVEMAESNNGLAAAALLSVTSAPLPDLAPVSFTLQQSTVDAGQPILFEERVLNQGVADASLFQVGLYLSTDIDIDPADDVFLGSRAVPGLAAGQVSDSGPQSLVIPGSTAAGSYFVGLVVDAGDFVPEAVEDNNLLIAGSALVVTVPPMPDLRADSFEFGPGALVADGTGIMTISASFSNAGTAPSTAVQATVYLSSDNAVTTADIAVGAIPVEALAPGSGVGRTVDLPLPGGIASGSYRVGVWIDDADVQPELDESNNLLVAAGLLDVTGGGPSEPNLVGEEVLPSTRIVAPGDSIQMVTRIANTGDLSTPAFRVGVYLSTDDRIEPADTLLGDRIVPFGLGGGFSSAGSAPITIPVGTPDGTYRIGLLADWQDTVVESDETDNGLVASGSFEVRTPPPPRPNLVIPVVSSTAGATVEPGDVFDLTHEVRNSGDLSAGTFRVGFYLSDDETIDSGDVLLASRLVTGLDAGSSETQVIAVQIPPGTAAGAWYLGALADDQGAVEESDEDDNGRAVTPSFDI